MEFARLEAALSGPPNTVIDQVPSGITPWMYRLTLGLFGSLACGGLLMACGGDTGSPSHQWPDDGDPPTSGSGTTGPVGMSGSGSINPGGGAPNSGGAPST